MAHVGGVIASAILAVVSKQIMSAIKGQIKLQWNFVSDLQKMRSSLQTVEALLEDAERRSITDQAVRLWLGRLKDTMYEISDMIDDFEVNTEPATQKCCPPINVSKLKMANKMKNMREQLKGIAEDRIPFIFMQENAPSVPEIHDNRETTAAVTETQVAGRDNDKQEIMARLSGSITKEITILPIYGIGGIGKTTMAQLVFKDSHFKEYSRVWVYVSQKFDLNKIGNSIISQLSNCNSQHTDPQMVENNVQRLFSGKKILIILDDLWEMEAEKLERLKTMLELGEGSNVVAVVTTREEYIAQKIQTLEPYKLTPLGDDICWTIIKDKTSFDARTNNAQLELIGKDIAKKCGGMALAAQSIGYMLYSMKSVDQWVSVNNSEFWHVLASEESSSHQVHASLLLSYRSMGSYLKLCFGYCAVFPKGHKISKEELVHQWIALGLVKPSKTFSDIQTSESYINHLLGMSFLEHPKSQVPWTSSAVAVDVGAEGGGDVVAEDGGEGLCGTGHGEGVDVDTFFLFFVAALVRALAAVVGFLAHLPSTGSSGGQPIVFASSEATMDVLTEFFIMHDLVYDLARSVVADEIDIESPTCRYAWLTDGRKLFNSSGTPLLKIRALHFHDPGDFQLHGDFSPAKCLRVLDLRRWCTRELPDSIGQLRQLRYLDASWYFRSLESIRIPKALGALTKLQYLNLSDRGTPIGLPEVISKLTELRYLNISSCRGYYSLDNPSANQSFIDCIGTLPNLEHLDLSRNDYGFSVPESFSSLKKLNLEKCTRISSLPENVGKLDIQNLFGLLKLGRQGFYVRADDSESSSSLVWLKHTNPDELSIVGLENVKSVEEARIIRLMEKHNIEKLTLNWREGVSSVGHMVLLTELVPPPSVKDLMIVGYKGVIFPHWLMPMSRYLPNLVSLALWNLPCSSLPRFAQLPNLRSIVLGNMYNLKEFDTSCPMGEDGANEFTLPKLEYLKLDNCPKLMIKPCPPRAVFMFISRGKNVLSSCGNCAASTVASSSSPPVSKLKVEYSELPLRQWRLLHHLPGLSDVSITHCDDLTISPQISQAFVSLESLSLESISLKCLPEWVGELPSLRQLSLIYMNCLQELDKNLKQLTQLQSLSLDMCNALTSLPQWLGELTLLKTLKIRTCESITSLPESILTNLQELRIQCCPQLDEWCKLKENQMKLAHIKEMFFY
nr:putative disease resistance protein RGA1 [Aegilops tauschii subsp. strangulata]